MQVNNHHVRKLTLQARGMSVEKVFPWQTKMEQYLKHDFSFRLGLLLDELCTEDELVFIDQIHITIPGNGDISSGEANKELLFQLRKAIQLAKTKEEGKASPEKIFSGGATGTKEKTGSIVQAWLFFMKNGHYPWWKNQLTLGEWKEMLEKDQPFLKFQLESLLLDEEVRRRMAFSLSQDQFSAVLSILFGKDESHWSKYLSQLRGLSIWGEAYKNNPSYPLLHALLLQRLLEKEPGMNEVLSIVEMEKWINKINIQEYLQPVNKMEPMKKEKPGDELIEPDHEIWVENAGIVLIHPFLPALFHQTGVTGEQDMIVQPGKSLRLLHFLLYGHDEAVEHELVLCKLLCGLPLKNAYYLDEALSVPEKEECDQLLTAVIEHWNALRNTSRDGLRQGFFYRKGKLSVRDDQWLLQIEERTEDILLDQLPWSIGVIRLPWMRQMMWVEWRR